MNRKKILIFCFILYAILWIIFLRESFTLFTYTSCRGQMLSKKEALLVCSKKETREIGYIDNKKYLLKTVLLEKQTDEYYFDVFFKKEQPIKQFTIYFKEKKKNIWKILKEEWRIR